MTASMLMRTNREIYNVLDKLNLFFKQLLEDS